VATSVKEDVVGFDIAIDRSASCPHPWVIPDSPVYETELVDCLYSQGNFCHIKSSDVFRKDFVLDKHCHEISTRKELHEHVEEGVVLERCVQLDDPRAVGLGKNISFGADVGELVFLELRLVN
jgi:hypothetical protein